MTLSDVERLRARQLIYDWQMASPEQVRLYAARAWNGALFLSSMRDLHPTLGIGAGWWQRVDYGLFNMNHRGMEILNHVTAVCTGGNYSDLRRTLGYVGNIRAGHTWEEILARHGFQVDPRDAGIQAAYDNLTYGWQAVLFQLRTNRISTIEDMRRVKTAHLDTLFA